jgi:hypothetical protein
MGLLVLLGLLPPPYPPPEDYLRFAGGSMVHDQVGQCETYLRRVQVYRDVNGPGPRGEWDQAVAEVKFRLRCWETLSAAYATTEGPATARLMRDYLGLVGEQRYRQGWTPPPTEWPKGVPDPVPKPPRARP